MSELLGKGTIDKKSSGETKGRQGSSSRNYDVLGRELLTPDEARKLDNKKCLILIRGFNPIIDNKFIPFGHPAFIQTADGEGQPYVHKCKGFATEVMPYQILNSKSVAYYEQLKEKGGNVYIDSLSYEEFHILSELEMKKRFISLDEQKQRECMQQEQENELEYANTQEPERTEPETGQKAVGKKRNLGGADTIVNRMAKWSYSKEQKEELHKMMAIGIPTESILAVFYPETDIAKLREFRKTFKVIQNKNQINGGKNEKNIISNE